MNDENNAIKWLEGEYLRKDGTSHMELIYIDYSDKLSDAQLQEVLKDGYLSDESWIEDAQYESTSEIISNYRSTFDDDDETELDEDVEQSIRTWCYEHDMSNPTKDLLKHTGSMLFYVETGDEFIKDEIVENGYMTDKQYPETVANNDAIVAKYAKSDDQKNEIRKTFNESFYNAPISFYFYADVQEVYDALHGWQEKELDTIVVKYAYLSTIDRVQGSNWLGDNAVFTVAIPKADFLQTVFLDKAGAGYPWDEIAGQTGYDDAIVTLESFSHVQQDAISGILTIIETEVSDTAKRENELQKHWDETGHCTHGDMNWKRHKEKDYSNDFPCGSTCRECKTFWID